MTRWGEPMAFMKEALAYDGDECCAWPFAQVGGRGVVYLDGKLNLVSRIICETLNGPPPTPEHEAAHSCGRGHAGCCTPSHLRWATHKENMDDMIVHGTRRVGSKSAVAKLTDCDVLKIRSLAGAVTQNDISRIFGVSETAIHQVLAGKSYRDLPHTGQSAMIRDRNKDRCIHGHALTTENTYCNAKGHKSCKVCRRQAFLAFKARSKEQSNAPV